MMRSANPALSDAVFTSAFPGAAQETMTIQGTANKALMLLMLLLAPAAYVWNMYFSGRTDLIQPIIYGGFIAGFVVALITIFKKTWAPVTAPIYALLEGLALGGISAVFESRFPGIAVQAVGLTFAIFGALLLAYKSRLIKATENFKLGLTAVTGGIAIFYLSQIVLSFFGVRIPYIHESGMIGIGFSLFICIIAALNLVMDFDFIESGEARRAPKYMEWYAAFGLLVTLIWLYLEILRLLSKLQSRK